MGVTWRSAPTPTVPCCTSPDDIPSIEEAKLSPTELPFTKEDFEPQMAQALELLPELLDDENAGIQHAINGLLSLTPDGAPLLGETPDVKGTLVGGRGVDQGRPRSGPHGCRVDDRRPARIRSE